MKKLLFLAVFVCCLVLSAGEKFPKYIILFIGDGMASPQRMVAEEFAVKSGYGKLAMNHLPFHATTRTASANSLVTDSAAAGTAIACGEKTENHRIGVGPDGKVRLESVAEYARKKGWKVGIVSTMVINHATPASFYGHRPARSQYYDLGLDLIDSGFDYFAGGGFNQKNKGDKEARPDLYELARKKGYKTLMPGQKKEFLALKPGCGKMIYSASPGYMPAALDTGADGTTLAEMTVKGLELLKNPKGFFFMVEGGTIDVYGHANDAAGNLREVLALDEAVRAALKFAEKYPEETLILTTGDHETGGMSMGFAGSGYSMFMERLKFQKMTAKKYDKLIADARKADPKFSFEDSKKLLTENFGFKFSGDVKQDPMVLDKKQIKTLEEGFKNKKPGNAARMVMSQKAGIGWTSGAHTGLPVLTTAKGVGAENFVGFIDNTDIARRLKALIR